MLSRSTVEEIVKVISEVFNCCNSRIECDEFNFTPTTLERTIFRICLNNNIYKNKVLYLKIYKSSDTQYSLYLEDDKGRTISRSNSWEKAFVNNFPQPVPADLVFSECCYNITGFHKNFLPADLDRLRNYIQAGLPFSEINKIFSKVSTTELALRTRYICHVLEISTDTELLEFLKQYNKINN